MTPAAEISFSPLAYKQDSIPNQEERAAHIRVKVLTDQGRLENIVQVANRDALHYGNLVTYLRLNGLVPSGGWF
jgi:hypothetical protein